MDTVPEIWGGIRLRFAVQPAEACGGIARAEVCSCGKFAIAHFSAKMRFTETVDVARHDTLGEFEGMEKDIFAKKTEGDGNAHVSAVEFSALVAAGDGIHGRNLQILGVFR